MSGIQGGGTMICGVDGWNQNMCVNKPVSRHFPEKIYNQASRPAINLQGDPFICSLICGIGRSTLSICAVLYLFEKNGKTASTDGVVGGNQLILKLSYPGKVLLLRYSTFCRYTRWYRPAPYNGNNRHPGRLGNRLRRLFL